MYTIVTANQKGGVGKTTTAAAVGASLHSKGLRVLFVDADPQGNLSRMAGAGAGLTMYDVLKSGRTVSAAAQRVQYGHIVPSDTRLAEEGILTGARREYRIKEALAAVRRDYDVCIIDTPPTLGALTVAALTAGDGVIVPARADRFSVDGLRTFYGTFAAVKEHANKNLVLLGVVVTAFNKGTNLNRAVLEALDQQARNLGTKVYSPPIRRTVTAEEWEYTGDILGTPCTAASDYEEVTDQILKDIR